MEYTKDIVFNVKRVKKTSLLHIKIKKMLKLIQKDNYFTLTIIISILCLSLDYLIVKRFIEIVSLL